MKRVLLALCATGFLLSGPIHDFAWAHSVKKGTMPAAGASIEAMPAQIEIMFDSPARLTRVKMMHTHGEASHEERLVVPSDMGVSARLDAPDRGPGVYVVDWRALSADGHRVTGSFSFTVTDR